MNDTPHLRCRDGAKGVGALGALHDHCVRRATPSCAALPKSRLHLTEYVAREEQYSYLVDKRHVPSVGDEEEGAHSVGCNANTARGWRFS